MRSVRALLAVASFPFLAGCGYIHFGRLPKSGIASGDQAIAQAYTNLGTEHKIMREELALARKEGEALRTALERTSGGAGTAELARRLEETARELATLRASQAKLQGGVPGPPAEASAATAKFSELEKKFVAQNREFAQLREDHSRVRADLDRTRTENAALVGKLKIAVAQNDQAQAALSQLNTELLSQKEARNRAEQAAAAARAQLSAVIAQSSSPAGSSSSTPAPAPTVPFSLQLAKSPPAGASATAELRTTTDRLRPEPAPGEAGRAGKPAASGRMHVVQPGDTLEKIARQYYNDPDRWRSIHDTNSSLLGGRPLTAGMELTIPEP